MLVLGVFLFILSCASTSHIRKGPGSSGSRRIPEVDGLLEGVISERWSEREMPCQRAVVELLHQVQNSTLWATWIWDSMQRPSGLFYASRYQLGNYDQCLQAPWSTQDRFRTQYCIADVYLTDVTRKATEFDPHGEMGRYFESTSKYGRKMHILTWGVCMPAVCSSSSVVKIIRLMYLQSHLSGTTSPNITVDSCQKSNAIHKYNFGFYAFLYLFGTLFLTAVLSTFYSKSFTDPILSNITKSFCMERNWYELLKVYKDEIQTLNGIRSFNTGVTVVIHYLYTSNLSAVVNGLDLEKDLDTKGLAHVTHVDIIIETFFVISGLLHMKGMMSARRSHPVTMYLKRYLRLIGPFAMVIFFIYAVSMHMGSGPLWDKIYGREHKDCQQNWWLGLLMLNNHINNDRLCYIVTWYIQCDYQLAIIAGILYYVYQRNRRNGVTSYLVVIILSMMIPALITYIKDIPPFYFSNIDVIQNFKDNVVLKTIYIMSYGRASAYLVGMGMGYLMTVFKPANYSNIIPKNWSLLGFLVAMAVLQKVLAVGVRFFKEDYTALEAAIFVSLDKVIWALAICCIIAVCEYGTVPVVSGMLKSYLFVPVSRLSYGVYLTHMLLIYRKISSVRAPLNYDIICMIIEGIGVVAVSGFVSLLLWFTVEAPLTNLTNHLFKSK